MKYLVTGAGGFIGSHLAEQLTSDGHSVIALDRFSPGKNDNLASIRGLENLSIVKRDVRENLSDLFEAGDIDAVFHLAAMPKVQYSIEHPLETFDTNATGTVNVLETCRQHGVQRFVFSSSCAVYGNQEAVPFRESMSPHPMSPYASQKLMGEQWASLYHALYGMETTSLRYFNVFGPRQDHRGDYANLFGRFITRLKAGEPPIINGDGTNTRDYVHVHDVVGANILAAQTKNTECFGEVINIGSGRSLSVNDVAERILAMHPTSIAPEHRPPVIELKSARADISKAHTLLGWTPSISVEDSLPETYTYFMNAS